MKKLVKPIIFRASIKKGVLTYDNERYFRGTIQLIPDTDVRVIIEPVKGTRSKAANRYLWGVVYPLIGASVGYSAEELHSVMKSMFLKTKRLWRGTDITILKSTTELTTDEFGEFIEKVIKQGNELGVEIPLADKNYDLAETLRRD